MGYVIAAMAKITKLKPAPKVKTDWAGWCDDVAAGGLKLSAAAKSSSGADLKSVSSKISASCNACHTAYRK